MADTNHNESGAAAPGGENEGNLGAEMMASVAGKLGVKVKGLDAPAGADEAAEEAVEEIHTAENAHQESADAGETGSDQEAADETEGEGTDETDEGEGDEPKSDEGAADPAKEEKDAAKKEVAAKLKDLPPEVRQRAQAVIDGVIGRVVAKERAENGRLGQRVTQLSTELEAAQKAKGPTVVGNVNPMFMVDDESAIADRVETIERFERWARKNQNGSNLPDSERYDPKQPSYTADQIEAQLETVLHEKNRIIPAARANLQQRAVLDTNLRKFYPAVFDPKTPEYAAVQQVLKTLPELKQFADYRIIALKQFLGDKALTEIVQKQIDKKPAGQSGKTDPKAPRKTPPRSPGSGSPAKGGALERTSSKPAAAQAVSKFAKDPSRKNLASAALSMMTGA